MCACNSWLCNHFGEGAWHAVSTEITLISLKNHHWCLRCELSSNSAMVWRSLKNIPECQVNVPLFVYTNTRSSQQDLLMPVKEKKCRGVYVTCIILSVTSPSLPRYLFIYVKANLYSISGMASVYISRITPTFYIPGAQLSLGLLVIPITVKRSCTCPPGREHPSTSWCRVCLRAEN